MRTLFRYLLWILIMALPLQSSAVTLMMCDAGATSGLSASHDGDGAGPLGHHGGGAQSASTHDAHCGQAGDTATSGTHAKCSHCASCVTGPAAPPAMPALPMPATFSTFAIAAADAPIMGHIPATLERPPRVAA